MIKLFKTKGKSGFVIYSLTTRSDFKAMAQLTKLNGQFLYLAEGINKILITRNEFAARLKEWHRLAFFSKNIK